MSTELQPASSPRNHSPNTLTHSGESDMKPSLILAAAGLAATLLGVPVDVLTPADLPAQFRAQVLAQARPV